MASLNIRSGRMLPVAVLLSASAALLCVLKAAGGLAFTLPKQMGRVASRTTLVGAERRHLAEAQVGLGTDGSSLSGLLLGGLASTLAVQAAIRRGVKRSVIGVEVDKLALESTAGVDGVALVKTPKDTFYALVEKGETNARKTGLKTFHDAVMGGAYVGCAGLLSLGIAGNMTAAEVGSQKFMFGALFPVCLLLVLMSGAQLFSGNTASTSAAYVEGRITLGEVLRNWAISWSGNVVGCAALAWMAWYTGLLTGGAADFAATMLVEKCSLPFGPTFAKAVMCNWLVCMAVFLALQAQDLTGKMVGIWFPISMFVAIGFEHSVANMFFIPAGLLSHAPLTIGDTIVRNLIPATLGNAIAGMTIIACGLSFAHGTLGQGWRGSFTGIWKKIKGIA